MVQFMSSENTNNVRKSPEPEMTSFGFPNFKEVEEEVPLRKRRKSLSPQTTNQEWSLNDNEFPIRPAQYNPLSEPSPLGLRLRKSPSLVELAQKRVNQCNTEKGALSRENLEVGNKKDVRARLRASGAADRLKASHFPALLLRIGQWEYVSKHEGDLVAKCYFSKHKIVWEVLDGGLKKKFEINWADIMALKANFPDNGLGALTIMLDKRPLFFKEINPQPRKHTQWQATSDFTDGEASMHRQHFLQCTQGVLDKHYEKLIQCDTRLNFLSQQPYPVLDLPYFVPEVSIKDPYVSSIVPMASPATLQTYPSKTIESGGLGFVRQDMSTKPHPTNSVISTHAIEVLGNNESYNLHVQNNIKQLKTCGVQPAISIPDLVTHIGNRLSGQNTYRNIPFSGNVSCQEKPKDMLENISEILLSDSHLTAASDEKILMSRVDSLCCLLQDRQKDGNGHSAPGSSRMLDRDGNYGFTPGYSLMHENRTQDDGNVCLSRKLLQAHTVGQQVGNDNSNPGSSLILDREGNDSFTPGYSLMHKNWTREDDNVRMSRILLQDHQNGQQVGNDNSAPGSSLMPHRNRNDGFTPDFNPMHENWSQEDDNVRLSRNLLQEHQNDRQDGNISSTHDFMTPQQDANDDSTRGTQQEDTVSCLSRKDSFADLLQQLPRIASLSEFVFDISENGEILK